MEYRGLRIARMLLFKLFWVQLAFLLIAWILYILCKDTVYPWIMAQSGIHISADYLSRAILVFFGLGKFVLYCVYLVPAIAIHCALRCLEKKPL